MAYCPDCGTRSENGAPACSSCGLVFAVDPAAADPKGEISDEHSTDFPHTFSSQTPGDASDGDWHSSYLMRDSQLGKGTIKPYSVEFGMDGYHFKFEEPPRRLAKPEPSKDKSKEFRVTDDDINRQTQEHPDLFEKRDEAAIDEIQTGISGATNMDITAEELSRNAGDKSILADSAGDSWADESDTIKESGDSPATPPSNGEAEALNPEIQYVFAADTDPEKSLTSPEDILPVETDGDNSSILQDDEKPDEPVTKIFWKGKRSFWGIPLAERYQITNQAIIVEIPKTGKHFEYSLSAVITAAVKQSWFDKIAGTGSVAIKVAAGSDVVEFDLKGISDPLKILKILADLIGPKYNGRHG